MPAAVLKIGFAFQTNGRSSKNDHTKLTIEPRPGSNLDSHTFI